MKKPWIRLFPILIAAAVLFSGCSLLEEMDSHSQATTLSIEDVPEFSESPYVEINGNEPDFSQQEKEEGDSFESYSRLDSLGRCGVAYACIGQDLMPTEDRESISQIKPSGWQTAEYDFVDGKYLYNRCHLIGFQLTGENANERNLITGTRYMNVEGMLPFENLVADYVKETGNHVLYRVTPVFEGQELVARGVEMEAWSVEDQGDGVCYHVYVYNSQPGVTIDYATGNSWETGEEAPSSQQGEASSEQEEYILNTHSHKFHLPDCPSADSIKESNREEYHGSREELLQQGYEPCGSCNP